VTGVNCAGVSLGKVEGTDVAGVCATEASANSGASKISVRTQWIGFI